MNLYRRVRIPVIGMDKVFDLGRDYDWVYEYYRGKNFSNRRARSKAGYYLLCGSFRKSDLLLQKEKDLKHFTHRYLGEWDRLINDRDIIKVEVEKLDRLCSMNDKRIDIKAYLHLLDDIDGVGKVADLIAKKYWGVGLDIPVVINNRLSRSYGVLRYLRMVDNNRNIVEKVPYRLDISDYSMRGLTKWAIVDLLKHEVCHWACLKMDMPSGDGAKFFESELGRINSTSSGNILVGKNK